MPRRATAPAPAAAHAGRHATSGDAPDAGDRDDDGELTVDQLAAAAGIPVRRIRFYAGRRLLPPPRLAGRVGLYGPEHLARLRLVADLQAAGFTLAAIEAFLGGIPADADADTVALLGTLAHPAAPGGELRLAPAAFAARVGRELTERDLDLLVDGRVVARGPDGCVVVTEAQLGFCARLLQVDAPLDALVEAGAVIDRHVGALAADLQRVFRSRIVAALDHPERDRAQLRALSAALRPLTIQAMVTSYHAALAEEVARQADRPAGPAAAD